MKINLHLSVVKVGFGLAAAAAFAPQSAHGCACGCGVFDVGTSSMFPNGSGGMAFVQYAYQDQNRNWSGTSRAPAINNDDKDLATDFVTLGMQYMFSRSWGFEVEVPYDFRHFVTTDSANHTVSRNWSQLADIRVEGIYTGFFKDLSAGLTLGVKLPTGSHGYDAAGVVDRDSELGTGSLDVLFGGFYRGHLDAEKNLGWFAQFKLDAPTLIQDHYRPGIEANTAAGLDFEGLSLGSVHFTPVAQVIFSERTSDSGSNSTTDSLTGGPSSGYQRLLLSPGVEVHLHPVRFYADLEVPVYQHFVGNQLAASWMVKCTFSVMF